MLPAKHKLLSIVVPAYKEAATIENTLKQLDKELGKITDNFEIICVVDGILDTTLDKLKKIKNPNLKILAYEKNMGKGYAVRFGLARSSGDIVGFMDANGINTQSIRTLYDIINIPYVDIVIASKRHPNSKVIYPSFRRLLSRLSQIFIKILFGIEVSDTQVGLKLFKKKVIKAILPRLIITDWIFDVEMLAVANYLGFNHLLEAPVVLELSASKDTSAIVSKGLFKVLFVALIDVLILFYHLKVTHFYADSNFANWP